MSTTVRYSTVPYRTKIEAVIKFSSVQLYRILIRKLQYNSTLKRKPGERLQKYFLKDCPLNR